MNRILRTAYIILFSAVLFSSHAQQAPQAITISGKVKKELRLAFSDIRKFPIRDIADVIITNHKGETKGTAKSMKGVLLRDVLEKVSLDSDNPKLFSEYFFICRARDQYKVVYSWNELFNTATGNSVYIVLEKDQQDLVNSDESILMISTQDIRTGRRYVKNLETIHVGRAE